MTRKFQKAIILLLVGLSLLVISTRSAKAATNGVLLINGAKQDKAAINSLNMIKKSLDTTIWEKHKKSTYSYNNVSGTTIDQINKEISKAYSGCRNETCFFYFVGNTVSNGSGISLKENSTLYSFSTLARVLYNVDCQKMVVVLDTSYANKFISYVSRVDKKGKFVVFAGSQQRITSIANMYYRYSKAFACGLGYEDFLMYGDINHDKKITLAELQEYCMVRLGGDMIGGADMDQRCELYAKNKNSVIANYNFTLGNSKKATVSSYNIKVNGSLQLYPYINSKKGNIKNTRWNSSNQSVAIISASGKVTGKKAGIVTITANYGGIKASCKVSVTGKNNMQLPTAFASLAVLKNYIVKNENRHGVIHRSSDWKLVGDDYSIEKDVDSNHGFAISYCDFLEGMDTYDFEYYTGKYNAKENVLHLTMYETNPMYVSIDYTEYYNKDGRNPEGVYYTWKNGKYYKYTGNTIPFIETGNSLKHYSLSTMKKEGNKQAKIAFKLWNEYLRDNADITLADLGFTNLKFDANLNPNTGTGSIENQYEKKIVEIDKDYNNQEKTLNTNGDKIIKDVMGVYDTVKDESLDTLSEKIETVLASDLPVNAKEALLKKFTDTIQDTLLVTAASYDECKTAPQLVKKVAEQICDEEGTFTFEESKITYTVNFKFFGKPGAAFIQGTIHASNRKNYTFGGTSINKSAIKEEMDNLKKFSESKLEEAKKEVYSTVEGVIFPQQLKSFLKTTANSKIYGKLKKKAPSLAKYVKAGTEMADKFSDVKKAYQDLKATDLKNASEDKVVKTIGNYNKKIEAYTKAVENLLNIQI
ncbi:MAG: Ig-like domain-containing protein [Eubacteriales bacterium]|nr:Ig-like domain-containing protein [Eubacteriales bacterium]